MSRSGHFHKHDDSSHRRLPPIREELGDLLDQPAWSGRRGYGPPVSPSGYHRGSSGYSSSHTTQGGYTTSQQQEPDPYPVHRHSDRYQQQSREPRDERRTNTREQYSYHVHSLTQIGLVHQSTSREDSFRLRPRKAEPGNPARKHICNECGASFVGRSALNTHKHSHSGEKPFRCNHPGCEKGFTSMSNKTRHERTHYATSAFEDANQARYSSRRQEGSSPASYYHHSSRER